MNKYAIYPLVVTLSLPASWALAQQTMGGMNSMDMGMKPAATAQTTHVAVGTVQKVDPASGMRHPLSRFGGGTDPT
jgi:hypothetical protein